MNMLLKETAFRHDHRTLLQYLPSAMCHLLDAEKCHILFVDFDKQELWSREESWTCKVGVGPCGSVARDGQPLLLNMSTVQRDRQRERATGRPTDRSQLRLRLLTGPWLRVSREYFTFDTLSMTPQG